MSLTAALTEGVNTMNYSELTSLALSYSDREDAEVVNRMDDFIKMTEARINVKIKTLKMAKRSITPTVSTQDYYSLPNDFAGLRDIEIKDSIDAIKKTTLSYLSPSLANHKSDTGDTTPHYTIIANQIQLIPRQDDDKILEVVYYMKVPNLNSTDSTNWISENNPDCYLNGLMVEINAFVKDAEAAQLWDNRFLSSIADIKKEDAMSRWSGTPLQIQTF